MRLSTEWDSTKDTLGLTSQLLMADKAPDIIRSYTNNNEHTLEFQGKAKSLIIFRPGLLGSGGSPVIYKFAEFLRDRFQSHVHIPASNHGYMGLLNVNSTETGAKQMQSSVNPIINKYEDLDLMFIGQSKGGADNMQFLMDDFVDEETPDIKERVKLMATLNSAIMGTHVRPGLAPELSFGSDITNDFGDLDGRAEKVVDYMNHQINTLIIGTENDKIVPLSTAIPSQKILDVNPHAQTVVIEDPELQSHWNAFDTPKMVGELIEKKLVS